MSHAQADLFAQKIKERNNLSGPERQSLRARLEERLAKLEGAETFPWRDPLDAVHEENRFERGTDALGEEGAELWARFDAVMDRLHATRPD